ncbi:uncharacterized protein UV8b_01771 [Ustilaginoidea virens]|uniref:Major facilitator superfamily (MFS) profile domain-containing protein n=1 Tax=Ustilaginoidea virens TaxID=1159556 RepID=A0A8E5HL81_USTVR|nr:uncharacterized protein UV8b_01771 [Ustilaginoidea virens]QUC17530.1 hypothetical protein UV8b_01771 [Ustilaginoidea virens]
MQFSEEKLVEGINGANAENERKEIASLAKEKVTFMACSQGAIASIGGLIFGYVSGQISGFFLMDDFARRFGEPQPDGAHIFSAARQGTIVGMLSVGAAVGSLIAGKLADKIGRRKSISAAALFACIGTTIEISSSNQWIQFAMGRFVSGASIGALSVVVPMYQSESAPTVIRAVIVSSYQLFVTLGIWMAEMVNWGTQGQESSASWRTTNGLSFAWAVLLGTLILSMPESPRYDCNRGQVERARETIAKLSGLSVDSQLVTREIADIQANLHQESQSSAEFSFSEILTAPRILYRTVLGIALQAGQQLTGANFFFYFGTAVFAAAGVKNSYTTMIILGSVNMAGTLISLWVTKRFGRRSVLMIGAALMTICYFVFSFVGQFALDHSNPTNTPAAGSVLVAFSCFAIGAFAVSWGPLVWAVNSELYPLRYRSVCMGLATASNWLWNFLISFFTRFITDKIGYLYGLVFAGCCSALVLIVFFFVIESKDRSLEEIDAMYVHKVNPIQSGHSTGHWNWDEYRQGIGKRNAARAEAQTR